VDGVKRLGFCDDEFADGVIVAHGGVEVVLVVDGDAEGDFVAAELGEVVAVAGPGFWQTKGVAAQPARGSWVFFPERRLVMLSFLTRWEPSCSLALRSSMP
jgi:hypothetical protein